MHKGFVLYDIMAPLMPSLAAGTNVYRPSEGTRGAASATLGLGLRGPELPEAEDNTGNSPPASNHGVVGFDGPNRDQEIEPPHLQRSPPFPPTSPPPSSPSPPIDNTLPTLGTSRTTSTSYPSATGTTSAPSMSTASKRKRSALHASQSNASAPSQSNASGIKKQRTTTGAVALNGIKESLDAFNTTLGRSIVLQQPERGRADTSPERRAKAMEVLQEQESYLDDDRLVAFIDLFRADTAAADAYLAIKRESLRKKWVGKQLTETLGFPSL